MFSHMSSMHRSGNLSFVCVCREGILLALRVPPQGTPSVSLAETGSSNNLFVDQTKASELMKHLKGPLLDFTDKN